MARTMWLSLCALTLLPPMSSGPGATRYAIQEKDTMQRTMRFDAGSARAVEVRNINGPIRIIGSDGDAVDLVANRTINAASQSDVSEARRLVRLETTATANGLNVCADVSAGCRCDERLRHEPEPDRRQTPGYRVDVDFELRVPRGVVLRLCTVNGGDVALDHTSGDFTVNHVNGGITLSDVHGSGRVTTVNGGVKVSLVNGNDLPSTFSTVNGDVVVELPGSVSLDLRLKTVNGGLFTNFDTTAVAEPVAPQRRGAATVYRSPRDTRVRVGQGGPELSLETVNGDVRVLRR